MTHSQDGTLTVHQTKKVDLQWQCEFDSNVQKLNLRWKYWTPFFKCLQGWKWVRRLTSSFRNVNVVYKEAAYCLMISIQTKYRYLQERKIEDFFMSCGRQQAMIELDYILKFWYPWKIPSKPKNGQEWTPKRKQRSTSPNSLPTARYLDSGQKSKAEIEDIFVSLCGHKCINVSKELEEGQGHTWVEALGMQWSCWI